MFFSLVHDLLIVSFYYKFKLYFIEFTANQVLKSNKNLYISRTCKDKGLSIHKAPKISYETLWKTSLMIKIKKKKKTLV